MAAIRGKRQWPVQLLLLFLSLALASIATIALCYAYFNEARFHSSLEWTFPGSNFSISRGQGSKRQGAVVLTSTGEGGVGLLRLPQISIQVDRFQSMGLWFSSLPGFGSLSVAAHFGEEGYKQWQAAPINHDGLLEIPLAGQFPLGVTITDLLVIQSGPMVKDLILDRVVFNPNQRNFGTIVRELSRSFQPMTKWLGHSINNHGPESRQLLLHQKPLILLATCLAVVIYTGLSTLIGRRPIRSGVLIILLPWLIIDTCYLTEQLLTARNVYNTYHHLSNDQKSNLVSPHLYNVANTILQEVNVDSGGTRADIFVFTGVQGRSLSQADSVLRYLDGRLKYYLLPHNTYTRGLPMPPQVMQQGGFYLANITDTPFAYDSKRNTVDFQNRKLAVVALINNSQLQLFRVEGPVHRG
ncbi:MAG: hypothetical protein KDI14_17425 [Halioglobus sp.]|nr:hypothetical protein [Halioglobus sp.]